jgi:hypothetical protein
MSSTGAFQYWQRTMVHAGPGTVVRLPGLFEGLGARRVLLVSDKGLGAHRAVRNWSVYSRTRHRMQNQAVSTRP